MGRRADCLALDEKKRKVQGKAPEVDLLSSEDKSYFLEALRLPGLPVPLLKIPKRSRTTSPWQGYKRLETSRGEIAGKYEHVPAPGSGSHPGVPSHTAQGWDPRKEREEEEGVVPPPPFPNNCSFVSCKGFSFPGAFQMVLLRFF